MPLTWWRPTNPTNQTPTEQAASSDAHRTARDADRAGQRWADEERRRQG